MLAELLTRCPAKVWIGTMEFPIHFVEPTHEQLDGGDNEGCCLFDPPAIYISETLSLTKAMEIIWHEITHGLNYSVDIVDGVEEEDIARRHGVAWSQFWINNPRFARWWLAMSVAVRKAQDQPKRKNATRP